MYGRAIEVDGVLGSMMRWCNNGNVLHFRFADFERVIDSANSYNVLAGMNVVKVILPIGSCHGLANNPELLVRLHLKKRDSHSDHRACETYDVSFQVGSTQDRGRRYEDFQQQNEIQ